MCTLKAKPSRPNVKPGRGWYRVPALATTASFVVGPWSSRAATLSPDTSEVSKVEVEAAEAKARRCNDRPTACRAFRASDDLGIIVRFSA